MKLRVAQMDEMKAAEILGWRYEAPYDFYNNEYTAEGRAELLSGSYRALEDENDKLVGFFCTGAPAQVPIGKKHGMYKEDAIDMGLGLHPALTGKGEGLSFCTFIVEQIEKLHPRLPIRLTVAAFNKRAIHLYEKLGFVKVSKFSTSTADFDVMIRNVRDIPEL
ncbi:GNAT family N-acetyltransferase [Lysinibacillus odysseyi]|uniref:Acetyltransferase n=1 Tax=Lysinibacillus odysseyi 34hs-1 = NBRC 100172 TaxID=1220589 RepID=A0A0A3ILN2_9BACI|nr:GNAT family N-acetyltransferase [Lysinibacillus odysseyi]KGR84350.1 acetyltransferase [Lysinibacillus odysseyi 34hs-1 = NBRC 100172]